FVRAILAPSGRGHLQGVCEGAAFRRHPRSPVAPRAAFHEGAIVKVAIVDYGAGNLPSVERALRAAGAETNLAARGAELADADSIVLPGVGHFDAIVAGLQKDSLGAALESAHQSGVPILGICLGLQVMFSISDESPQARGLGFLPGAVRALPPHVKSPHIGWNQVRRLRESVLLCGVPEDAYFYFAH